jgi:hypothetical protein
MDFNFSCLKERLNRSIIKTECNFRRWKVSASGDMNGFKYYIFRVTLLQIPPNITFFERVCTEYEREWRRESVTRKHVGSLRDRNY